MVTETPEEDGQLDPKDAVYEAIRHITRSAEVDQDLVQAYLDLTIEDIDTSQYSAVGLATAVFLMSGFLAGVEQLIDEEKKAILPLVLGAFLVGQKLATKGKVVK